MSDAKRATVYFDVEIHRALKLKAAANDRTISDLVNDAVRLALVEDAVIASPIRFSTKSLSFPW